MRYAVALLAVLLSACASRPPVQWVKAGGDDREKLVCQLEAEKAAVSSDPNAFIAAFEKADRRQKIMYLCMRSKGWARTQ